MRSSGYDGFFIGWGQKLPKGLGVFLLVTSIAIILLFAGVAYFLSVTQNSPDGQGISFGFSRQSFTGILEMEPYPVLRVPPSEQFPDGHTILLSGPGKTGVQSFANDRNGLAVTATGIMIKRGTIDMMQLAPNGLKTIDSTSDELAGLAEEDLAPEDLGRWRLTGEICDGKCYSGAMRPGRGLAHKACANFCIIGGIPPVFVSTGAIEGNSFFMIGDENGKPLTGRILNLTAVLIDAEGTVERRGDLMVFKMDLDSVRVR